MENLNKKVCSVIAESLCVDESEVTMKSNLMRDLNAESIDFLDIMFRLEQEFDIRIPQREIESNARAGIAPEDFEVDGILQEQGASRLRVLLPEVPAEEIQAGMHMREIPAKFTVEVFCSIVGRKLQDSQVAAAVS